MSDILMYPGDFVCKEEEYLAYKNVYIDEEGNIRAAVIGKPIYDNVNRRVFVKPLKEVKIPRPGETVIGWVTSTRDDVAFIKIVGHDLVKTFKHIFSAILHISQVVEAKGENMYNYVRLGDIVKAKVLNEYLPLLISIKEPRLGVLLAYCSKCGSHMYLDNGKLVCSVCGNIEQRKVSLEYMLVRGKKSAKA
ncbi:MAG: exosome complex RNA-binding protein Csl4 [Ignisphaera sp.]|uniref:Exosome complex component Csl4 n=1 Tax=Ignisphaera aggregans TaxID=334771 RepID=A0A7C4JJJ6_9CREN